MDIGIDNTNYPGTSAAAASALSAAQEARQNRETQSERLAAVQVGATKETETYTPDMDKINAMKAELKNNTLAFKQMVYAMIKRQGGFAADAAKPLLEIDPETRLAAQKAISEDGYWGVEQTAQRILDFAKALSGGDSSAIPGLKDAVQKGFDAAEKLWGGTLPDISYRTLQKVMEGFDEWEQSGEI